MHTMPLRIQDELKDWADKKKLSPEQRAELMETVRGLYRRYTYDSEEPVGIVTAQSLSEPSTQMSLEVNEKIILKSGERIKTIRIGEFVDGCIREFGFKKVGQHDVCDLPGDIDIYALSLNPKEKLTWKRAESCIRHKSPEKLMKIETAAGRKITATDHHSFVIRKDNMVVPISGKQLSVGDRIPAISHLPENCLQSLDTEPLIGQQLHAKKSLPQRLKLDNEMGWVFGAYLSEGNATEFYVSFSNTNQSFLSNIRNFAEYYGFTFNEYDNLRGFAPAHDIRINSKQLSNLMKNTCSTGSSSKRVPDFAFSAEEEFVSGLLRGYFDGDGNVAVNRKMIRVHSNSEELIDGIKLLLTRFRIFASKCRDKKQHYLVIPYKYAPIFLDKIGSDIEEKRERLEKLSESAGKFWETSSRDFNDMIGGFGDLFYQTAKKLNYPTRYVSNFTKRQRIGRTALCRYINLFQRMAEEKGVNIDKELEIMRNMFNSDVVWDRIVKISYVEPEGEYVYDISVPGTETFTTFDGIVTHNTMRTYHFAGTAGIQVTLGLPRLLEIFDARKEPKTPTMTVYIEKEYQSIEKARKIADNVKEVRAKDIILSTVIDLTALSIRCKLDMKKLSELEVSPEKLSKIVKIRNIDTGIEGDELVLKPKKSDLKNIHKIKQAVLETHVKGIKGISQVVITREGEEWIISTLGSNLKKVFTIEGVDVTRTASNNIFEVYDVLGIEAARNAIIQQSKYTMEEQGLGVDVRYVMLLADLMTFDGVIRAIGRYGISGQKASVFVRASFEETKKHITYAAIRGEKDPLKGTIENIIMNQVAPIGTGAFDLIGRIPEVEVDGRLEKEEAPAKPAKPTRAKPAKAAAKSKSARKTAGKK